jgi:hypothetical protein
MGSALFVFLQCSKECIVATKEPAEQRTPGAASSLLISWRQAPVRLY